MNLTPKKLALTTAALLALSLPTLSQAECVLCDTFIPLSMYVSQDSDADSDAPDAPATTEEEPEVQDEPRRSAVPS